MNTPRTLVDVVSAAAGRMHRDDPALPRTGGPAGNAQLTALIGLVLLALFLVELVTLVSITSLISWHIVVGVLLTPPAIAKTASTGWRIARYYTGARPYRQAGPPLLVLRLLGPLVVLSTLAILGSGLALIAIGPSATFAPLLTVAGQRVSPLTIHQATFVVWGVATGLHVLAQAIPAARLAATAVRRGADRLAGTTTRALAVLLSFAVGSVAAALVLGLSGSWTTGDLRRFRQRDQPAATTVTQFGPVANPAAPALFADRLLVYTFGGMTPTQVTLVTARVGQPVTAVYAGEVSVASGKAGYPEIPVETLTADPAGYAAAAGRPSLAAELSTGLVLSQSEAALRHVGVGQSIQLVGGPRIGVTAIVDDHELGGAEMATSPAVLGQQAARSASYLLVADDNNPGLTTARVHQALPGQAVRIKSNGDNGFMSSVDTVLTQAQIKQRFGEFAMRLDPAGGGYLVPDPAWENRWIVTRRIPQLGLVTCNKAIVDDLTAAMQEITDRGLGAIVHTADFELEGGSYNPRVIPAARGGTLAAHSWGIAVDINVDTNPLGASPHQDPRLVAIMASHGFAWGGNWLRTDAAHFEWVGNAVPH